MTNDNVSNVLVCVFLFFFLSKQTVVDTFNLSRNYIVQKFAYLKIYNVGFVVL